MREYMAFGPFNPAFCCYIVAVYTPDILGIQTEYCMSAFVRVILINTIMVVFTIVYWI